jgi:hypothetical protein
MKHNIEGLELGILHRFKTNNPESSRKLIARQVERLGLRWLYRLEDKHIMVVLWNDKMFKR